MAETKQRTVHVLISGRVQGVYYRGWTMQTALRLGLTGWVRNRYDRQVEAVFAGEPSAVAEMLEACALGPPDAEVTGVQIMQEGGAAPDGFEVLADA